MADIDNIPLEFTKLPLLESYDAGLLWNPENGAANEDWHTVIRTQLDIAEDHYERQFDHAVDIYCRAQRQAVLLSALVSRMLTAGVQHGLREGTAEHVEGGLKISDPFLIQIDSFINEYQKIEGAFPIGETEGFRRWNLDAGGEPTPDPAPVDSDPEIKVED